MVAVFNLYKDFGGTNGSPGTSTNTDALGPPMVRFKTADNATIDTNHPIPIVASATKYSYVNWLYLKCATAPSVQVDNLKFYTDGGGFGTGITVYVGDQFPTKNSGSSSGYKVATGVQGDSGTEMVALGAVSSKTNAFTYTSPSALLAGPSISESGNIINAQNETSNYLVLQMMVEDTATPGNLDDETFVIQYDEI